MQTTFLTVNGYKRLFAGAQLAATTELQVNACVVHVVEDLPMDAGGFLAADNFQRNPVDVVFRASMKVRNL